MNESLLVVSEKTRSVSSALRLFTTMTSHARPFIDGQSIGGECLLRNLIVSVRGDDCPDVECVAWTMFFIRVVHLMGTVNACLWAATDVQILLRSFNLIGVFHCSR